MNNKSYTNHTFTTWGKKNIFLIHITGKLVFIHKIRECLKKCLCLKALILKKKITIIQQLKKEYNIILYICIRFWFSLNWQILISNVLHLWCPLTDRYWPA